MFKLLCETRNQPPKRGRHTFDLYHARSVLYTLCLAYIRRGLSPEYLSGGMGIEVSDSAGILTTIRAVAEEA